MYVYPSDSKRLSECDSVIGIKQTRFPQFSQTNPNIKTNMNIFFIILSLCLSFNLAAPVGNNHAASCVNAKTHAEQKQLTLKWNVEMEESSD
jgi:hypothetical protein